VDHTGADFLPSKGDSLPDEHEVDVPETNLRKLVNKQSDISDVRYFRRITLAVQPAATAAALAGVRVNINFPPSWLQSAAQVLRARHFNDRFELILRNVGTSAPVWGVRCCECPSKVNPVNQNSDLSGAND
jgi:hypothetical protein